MPEEEGEETVEDEQANRIIKLAMADAEELFLDQYKKPQGVFNAFTAVLIRVDPAVNSRRGQPNCCIF